MRWPTDWSPCPRTRSPVPQLRARPHGLAGRANRQVDGRTVEVSGERGCEPIVGLGVRLASPETAGRRGRWQTPDDLGGPGIRGVGNVLVGRPDHEVVFSRSHKIRGGKGRAELVVRPATSRPLAPPWVRTCAAPGTSPPVSIPD